MTVLQITANLMDHELLLPVWNGLRIIIASCLSHTQHFTLHFITAIIHFPHLESDIQIKRFSVIILYLSK